MPRRTTTRPEVKEEETTTPEEETTPTPESDSEPIDVIISNDDNKNYQGKIYVRQYSLEVHGDDYKALAEEFCKNKPKVGVYIAVPSSQIQAVEVRYREKLDYELHLDKQDPNAPIVDKIKRYEEEDKAEAVRFASQKRDSTVVVSRKK